MIFRYFSEKYSRYAEILPFEITQLMEDLSYGRLVPSKGLTIAQVSEIFSKFGLFPEIYIKQENAEEEFYRLLYYYIESGLPLLAGLGNHQHAITIIGHISDYNKAPSSKNSFDYLEGLIVNDDNCLPYQKLLKEVAPKAGYCSKYHLEDIDTFVVPLYEKIYFSAEYVDSLTKALFLDDTFGIDVLSKFIKNENIIKRIFLTSSKSYKKQRREQKLPLNLSETYCEMNMPKFIWVCEISTPELYPKEEIVGEVIIDATANHHERFSFLAIHYPDFLVLNSREKLTDDTSRFINGGLSVENMLSYSMYKSNLKEV